MLSHVVGMVRDFKKERVMTSEDKAAVAGERLLRRTEAAKYVTNTYGIPCSAQTLAKLACLRSDGPPFRHAGRFPLYPTSGLDAWAQRKLGPLVRSTSEVHMANRGGR